MIIRIKEDILQEISNGRVIKEIDLIPVNEITNALERILMKRKSSLDRSHIIYSIKVMEKIKELNKDQLEYLADNLILLVNKYADSLQIIYDNPEKECERIRGYKDLLSKKITLPQ